MPLTEDSRIEINTDCGNRTSGKYHKELEGSWLSPVPFRQQNCRDKQGNKNRKRKNPIRFEGSRLSPRATSNEKPLNRTYQLFLAQAISIICPANCQKGEIPHGIPERFANSKGKAQS